MSALLASLWLAGCALGRGNQAGTALRTPGHANARWLAACAADPSMPSCPSNPSTYAALGGAEVLDLAKSPIEASAERSFALGATGPGTSNPAPANGPVAIPQPPRAEVSAAEDAPGTPTAVLAAAAPRGAGRGASKRATRVPQQTVFQGVEVTLVSGAIEGVLPGAVVMLSLQVRNSTAQPMQLVEALRLPEGWRALQPPDRFLLPGGGTHLALLALSVPKVAAAGAEELTYDLREDGGTLRGSISIPIEVQAVKDLLLLAESSPELVVAGETYRASFRLVNQGNAVVVLDLEAEAADQASVRLEPSTTRLAPGQSRLVVAHVTTDAKRSRSGKQLLKLRAGIRGEEKGASAVLLTNLVPSTDRAVDLRHRFPVAVGGGVFRDRGDWGGFGEIRGSGHLVDGGSGYLDLLLRGPDSGHAGYFGRREELRASYHDEALDVRAGDHTYALSYLTSPLRYGRGGEATVRFLRGAEASAFLMKSRWLEPAQHQLGARLGYRLRNAIGDELEVRGNVLSKGGESFDGISSGDDRIASLSGSLRWRKYLQSSVEAGFSRAGENGARDWAIRATASGKLPLDIGYGLVHAYGAPGFRGELGDSKTTLASLNVPLRKRLSARATYQRRLENLELNPERATAPDNELLEAGLNAVLGGRFRVYAAYAQARLEDRLGASAGRGPERAAKLTAGYTSGTLSFNADARVGTLESTSTGERAFRHGYQGSLSYTPRAGLQVSTYGGWGSSSSESSYIVGSGGPFVGGAVFWKQAKGLGLDATWLSRGEDLSRHLGRLCGRYVFSNGSELLLDLRYQTLTSDSTGLDALSALLSFSVPLGVPIGHRKDVGAVAGHLFEETTGTSAGLARAVVRINGSTATTDRRGHFLFPALEPGDYLLQVELSSRGKVFVPTTKLPLTVHVEGGKRTRVEIGFTRSVSISGVVAIEPDPADTASAPGSEGEHVLTDDGEAAARTATRGLRGMLVEVSQDDHVRRTLTDGKGRFVFDNLLPGTWKLRVYEQNLPAYHELRNPTAEIHLGPGKSADVQVAVVPRRRQIRFIDSGTVQ